MGDPGIEPGTSFLSGTRSTTEPITQLFRGLNILTKFKAERQEIALSIVLGGVG